MKVNIKKVYDLNQSFKVKIVVTSVLVKLLKFLMSTVINNFINEKSH